MNRPIIPVGLFQKNPIEFSSRYKHLYSPYSFRNTFNIDNVEINEVPPTDEISEFVYFI